MSFIRASLAAATAVAALAGSTAGHAAQVIRVDFQGNASGGGFGYLDFSGVEAKAAAANASFASDGVDTWNHLSLGSYPVYTINPSFSGLLASTGETTGVTFSLDGPNTMASDSPLDANGSNALQNDYLVIFNGATINYLISGLTPNTLVSFMNYTPTFGGGGRGIDLTANDTPIHIGIDDAVLTSILTSSTGTISGRFTTPNGEGNWSGFQLAYATTAVPEPATWGMMVVGFGMIAGGLRRRRRQSTPVIFG